MKKCIMTAAVFLMAGAGFTEVLVRWDGSGSMTSTNEALNVCGQVFALVDSGRGSDDGWFGPDHSADGGFAGASTTTATGFKVSGATQIDVRITNHSGQDLDLAALVFDYQSIWLTGPQKLEVYYAYGALAGMANNTLLVTLDAPGESGGAGAQDYPDFEVDLQSSLADFTLADGQGATFTIQGIDADDSGVNGIVDNMAITGSVPEPVQVPAPKSLGLITMVPDGIIFDRG